MSSPTTKSNDVVTDVSPGSPGSDNSIVLASVDKLPLRKRIAAVVWDSFDKSPEDRALVNRIDWFIMTYVCLAYFVKYLDQTNVSNAYVSGMKEDLFMSGNDLNLLTTYWTIGYIIGQIPSQMIMTKISPSIWLPSLEIAWSIIVMGMSGAKNKETVFACRFFIGLLEASAYPGIMTLLGNWYLPSELGKRSCIFQASSSVAQMIGGYIQAGLYANMNGAHGLAAWRWLFIFDGIIGIPIGLYGYWAIPNSPTTTTARWLKPGMKERAIERMAAVGRKPAKPLTWRSIVNLVKEWPIYLFTAAFCCHILGLRVYSYFNVWLKATGKYSVEQVNVIPTAGYGMLVFFTLAYAWVSDALRTRWPVIIFGITLSLIGSIILSVSVEKNGSQAKIMAGFFLTFLETGTAGLYMSWINEVCSYSFEHRAVVIAVADTLAFAFNAWVPLLTYDTGEAPYFRIGYPISAMFFALQIIFTLAIAHAVTKWRVGKYEEQPADVERPSVASGPAVAGDDVGKTALG